MSTGADGDHQAVIDLTIRYCWALDGHRWDDLRSVFLADATADGWCREFCRAADNRLGDDVSSEVFP